MAASRRSLRPIVAGATYSILVAATFAFHILPNVLYRWQNGVNTQVAKRQPIELDIYGLRLMQMLTPVPGHLIKPSRDISDELRTGYMSEASQYFGLLAAVALITMLGWLALRVIRGHRADESPDVRDLLAA
ncbi:hypothetical protein, partial [Escherichia coli]|uniref:hypothetical protein n=1 Tax=Escherichia coli TaxID=562 RepID=UPI002B23F904